MGSISCERSFSALHRLKLWTRSTMTEHRLNGLAMLMPFPSRSLDSLKEDHSRFLTHGHGDIHEVKNYNNIIGGAIFDILIDDVSLCTCAK